MKKHILYILFLLLSFTCFSQVEVTYNTMYPNGMFGKKRVDTVYTLPRVPLRYFNGYGEFGSFLDTARTAISLTTTGSGVSTYNSTTGVLNIPDYSGGSGWGLTGNASTTFGTNYVGTSDDVNLMFRRNNSISGVLDSNTVNSGKTTFGVGAGANNTAVSTTAFGFKALAANTSQVSNSAFGNKALFAATTGGGLNSAFGYQALLAGTTFTTNTAVGATTMQNYTGSQSTAVGYGALINGSANGNTAIGRDAMSSGTVSGVNNTALGHSAGNLNSSGATNIYLGYQSGQYNTTVSNQLFISSAAVGTTYIESQNRSVIYAQQSATDLLSQKISLNGKTGLNTTAPTAFLHIMGRETAAAGTAPIKLPTPTVSLTTTAATGDGTAATLTYATTTTPAFVVGSTIVVAGVTPAGYNATAVVLNCTATTVRYTNATTGAQTVAGTITQGALMTTPEAYAVENDANDLYYTNSAATRFTIAKVLKGSATLDFPSTLTLNSSDLTVTVTGAVDGDVVGIGVPNGSAVANSSYSSWVSATNTVTIRLNNYSVGSVNPASGVFNVKVFKD